MQSRPRFDEVAGVRESSQKTASRMKPLRWVAVAFAALALGACSGKGLEGKKIDYRSASKADPLKVPKDLGAPPSSDRYSIPEANSGSATFSEYQDGQGVPGTPVEAAVLPQPPDLRIERAGSQRWLVTDKTPETLWPVIREFWQDTGFLIEKETPAIGIMETDWAENRAKIPEGIIRRALGKIIDGAYSYPERDRFRTRLERNSETGQTEIYISHRGMYEVVIKEYQTEQLRWQVRPSEPELEAEMLSRLMLRLGAGESQVKTAQADSPEAPKAWIVKSAQRPDVLQVSDGFDRAWRRVGLALDRVGFTVEDRDRSKGLYYVRFVDVEAREAEKSKGFWSKLFSSSPKKDVKDNDQYRISVADSNKGSEVSVLDTQGVQAGTAAATKILALLQQELK
ncbi:MAG: outer membrane protein assembly factor BamC [Burkholderiales bacterium]